MYGEVECNDLVVSLFEADLAPSILQPQLLSWRQVLQLTWSIRRSTERPSDDVQHLIHRPYHIIYSRRCKDYRCDAS